MSQKIYRRIWHLACFPFDDKLAWCQCSQPGGPLIVTSLPPHHSVQRVCFLSFSFYLPSIRFPPAEVISLSGAGRETGHGPPVVVSLYSAPAGVTPSSCAPPRAPTLSTPLSVSLGATPAGRKGSWPRASAWQETRDFGIAKRDRILWPRGVKVGTSYRRMLGAWTQIARSVKFSHAALYGPYTEVVYRSEQYYAVCYVIFLACDIMNRYKFEQKYTFFNPEFPDDWFVEQNFFLKCLYWTKLWLWTCLSLLAK